MASPKTREANDRRVAALNVYAQAEAQRLDAKGQPLYRRVIVKHDQVLRYLTGPGKGA